MAVVTVNVPDAVATVLNARAEFLGYQNAKAMTIDFLKREYKLQLKNDAKAAAKTAANAPIADPVIT